MISFPRTKTRGEARGLAEQAELRRGAAVGVQPPEIDGEVPRDGDDGFFALGAGGPAAAGEGGQPLFDRGIVRLETPQAPGALDQRRAQAWVAVLGHAALRAFRAAAVLAGTEPGVTADLAPLGEALPGTDLAAQDHAGEFAQAARHRRGGGRLSAPGSQLARTLALPRGRSLSLEPHG